MVVSVQGPHHATLTSSTYSSEYYIIKTPTVMHEPPKPLPSTLPRRLEDSKEIKDAYPKILKIEQTISAMIPKVEESTSPDTVLETSTLMRINLKLMHIRVLGYLIREGPSMKASEYVANEVNLCHDDKIEELGKFYCLHLIRPRMLPSLALHVLRVMASPQSGAPKAVHLRCPPNPHLILKPEGTWPRPCSFKLAHNLLEITSRQKKRWDAANGCPAIFNFLKALVRDDFRCVVSGRYDISSGIQQMLRYSVPTKIRYVDTALSCTLIGHSTWRSSTTRHQCGPS